MYTPTLNFSGTDQFTFKGNDGTSDSNVATVQLTVSGPVPAVVPRDTTAPTIGSVAVSPSRWRLGSALARISRVRNPVGTKISFSLSELATVKLAFERATPGRRVGGRCVATSPSNRRRARCIRYVATGALTMNGHAGIDRVAFQGRLSGTRKLNVGSYRLTVGASDPAGNRARTRSATFTIVAR
jgi:hypothetical protein